MKTPHATIGRLTVVGALTAALVTAIVPGPAAQANEPTGSVLNAGGATAVADRYIVVFKDSESAPSDVGARARDLATRHGGSVGFTYTVALRGFEAKVGADAAARIAADPSVAYVEQVHTVRALGTQPNPPSWGLDRIDQDDLPLDRSYTYRNTASAVHAYIIDTGIRFSHKTFGGRAITGIDVINGGTADDCNGHGTHVAGTVGGTEYGVAKEVTLVAVRVLGCLGFGSTAGVIEGIDWVTQNAKRPAVANMSLGGSASTAMDAAVRRSIASGVSYAIAAGNSDANACTQSPARVGEAMTVGASTITDARASFSNFGTCLDLFAPGEDITSAWKASDTATNTISGTSMAAPHVAGAAALVLQVRPDLSPLKVRNQLVNQSTANRLSDVGAGSPNRLL